MEARKFFQRCVSYLRKSIPILNDDVIKLLIFLRLPDRHKTAMDEMSILLKHFLKVVLRENINDLENEFLDYQRSSDT